MPIPNNETRFFQLQIRTGSPTGPVRITSNVITVVDSQQAFIQATGGYVTLEDGYKTHHFTTSNTFQVVGLGIPANRNLEYFVVSGGGGGGRTVYLGGGGGAGGIVAGNVTLTTTGNYIAIVGGGGIGGGTNGSNSNIVLAGTLNLHAIGGGRGAAGSDPLYDAAGSGGSGGGGSAVAGYGTGAANVIGQGYPGGSRSANPSLNAAAGGGGAGQAGFNGLDDRSPAPSYASYQSAQGGNGISRSWISPLFGTPSYQGSGWGPGGGVTKDRWFGGGGGGGSVVGNPTISGNHSIGWRGIGGGGGTTDTSPVNGAPNRRNNEFGFAGSTNTGGGGAGYDGGALSQGGSAGGSGFIAVRYPYTVETYDNPDNIGGSRATVDNSNVVYTLRTVNVSNATVLYWTMSGNVSNTDVLGGNTGSFTLINANATFTIRLATNIVTGTNTKVYTPELRKNSVTGPIVSTSNTIVIYSASNQNNFINATGGNVITGGGYRTHVLTSSNTFAVSSTGTLGGLVDYLIVAGGGGGAGGNPSTTNGGAGAGAGGMLAGTYTVSVQSYLANVGAGGTGGAGYGLLGTNGSNTDIFGILTVGGGGGSFNQPNGSHGKAGGSGAGAGGSISSGGVTLYGGNSYIGQGNPGGTIFGSNPGGNSSAGGGGAGGAGDTFTGFENGPRGGGVGRSISWVPGFYGTPGPTSGRWFAGGGGGGTDQNTGYQGLGGAGGGGRGTMAGPQALTAFSGNVFTGGGGGGGHSPSYPAGSGGSGIIIIRYPYV